MVNLDQLPLEKAIGFLDIGEGIALERDFPIRASLKKFAILTLNHDLAPKKLIKLKPLIYNTPAWVGNPRLKVVGNSQIKLKTQDNSNSHKAASVL